ncbi:MAG: methyltetrahydrofolate--corrinoid methyltransferase [Omnitrophica WOR_2 bacterium GWF2_43_52]|nr:MAG: methyltetrahydrofolate--corrinoid methyltransferase [Omnitrophica WOR_2 bacterium GWC2_44_8]OGX20964.1 MAG: methyltetrahydrofolate--corrinoid methyltransferase [Omnitrophica WOR_2 bacterium GWF2_43_52]HAH21143.1 methyltetrahydrofolate--corrinoid methyltransferase [Candidatus Omnitrophota bacterium]HBG63255.1 methyltetrahydrofolate--corrinoid methyltransferase [Candidatus Omnitrophota bacterium]HCD38743.1 methyltetrahydrofolate--corrinoid methyltransferase [Candidatus Omnitrophota bacter
MFIIGELINGMYKDIGKAIQTKDKGVIQQKALDQIKAGADALDVNCGPASKDPVNDIQWLITTIQEVTDKTIAIDSSRPAVVEAGLKVLKGKAIINSTTADEEKLEGLVPLALRYNAKLIGLTISKKGIPQNKDQRLELAAGIVAFAQEKGFPIEDLYLDPIVMPVNVAQSQMRDILESIHDFKIISDPAPQTVVGLSNVSQGTCQRSLVNRTFLIMAVGFGLDAAILDPLDKELVDSAITSDLVLNKHIYCDSYLDAYRKK